MPKELKNSPVKLAIFTSLKETFSFVGHHKADFLRISFVPTFFFFMSLMIKNVLTPFAPFLHANETFFYQDITLMNMGFSLLAILFSIMAFVTLTLADFRYILLGDHRPGEWFQMAWNYRHWRFIGCTILYKLILMGIIAFFFTGALLLLISLGVYLSPDSFPSIDSLSPKIKEAPLILGVLTVYALIGVFFFVHCMLRLMLFASVIAVDGENPLRVSWRILKGNVWRVLILSVLVSCVFFILYMILKLVFLPIVGIVGLFSHLWISHFVTPFFQAIFFALGIAISTSFQSVLYKALMGTPSTIHVFSPKKQAKNREK